MNRFYQIIRKEWAEVFKNRFVLGTVAFLPLMAALLPLGILYFVGSSPDITNDLEEIPSSFMALCNDLTGQECMQYFLISQFILLFMIIPLAIPITIASSSPLIPIQRLVATVTRMPMATYQALALATCDSPANFYITIRKCHFTPPIVDYTPLSTNVNTQLGVYLNHGK